MKNNLLFLLIILFISCTTIIAQTQVGNDINGEAEENSAGFAVSTSLDGSIIAVAAPFNDDNGLNVGHVRVYKWENNAWTQIGADIDGENVGDRAGYSVSLSANGNRIAIGAPSNNDNGTSSGHVRVYEFISNAWIRMGNDIDGENQNDQSGYAVSLSATGDRVAISAPYNSDNGSESGHVRIYEWVNNTWTQIGDDIDGEGVDNFSGYAVSLSASGTKVAIGAPFQGAASGHVRVFEWLNNTWTQVGSNIIGEAVDDGSGHSVSLSSDGNRIAIGAPGNNGSAAYSGHVRVFELNNNVWTQLGNDIDGEAVNDESGHVVSLSPNGNRVAMGAPFNSGIGSNAGHARVFEWDGNTWTQLGADIEGAAASDYCGGAVALSANGYRLVVGADRNDANGNNAGHVRVFEFPVVNIKENNISQKVIAYPNPTDGRIRIQLNQSFKALSLTIKNTLGQVIDAHYYTNTQHIDIDLKQNSGIYFLELNAKELPIGTVKILKY